MPKNVETVDRNYLDSIPLPTHGGRYTVVSHGFIIDEVKKQLQNNGLTVVSEVYKSNLNGEIAQGVYQLSSGTDPELTTMFAWTNSYDKSLRFRCACGAYIVQSSGYMISGSMGNYGRKHMGDAKTEVQNHISHQLKGITMEYNNLVQDKEQMKAVTITETQLSELMGVLFFKEDIISSSQLIVIKAAYKAQGSLNLWDIYNIIVNTFDKSHPKTWMEDQKNLHKIIKSTYLPVVQPVDPNQLTIDDGIKEVETEMIAEVSALEPEVQEDEVLDFDSYDEQVVPVTENVQEFVQEETEDSSEELVSETTVDFDLPQVPDDIPVYEEPGLEEQLNNLTEEPVVENVIPLDEQVAQEYVAPVSEEEINISSTPIVNQEDEVSLTKEGKLQPNPSFEVEEQSNGDLESPKFDF